MRVAQRPADLSPQARRRARRERSRDGLRSRERVPLHHRLALQAARAPRRSGWPWEPRPARAWTAGALVQGSGRHGAGRGTRGLVPGGAGCGIARPWCLVQAGVGWSAGLGPLARWRGSVAAWWQPSRQRTGQRRRAQTDAARLGCPRRPPGCQPPGGAPRLARGGARSNGRIGMPVGAAIGCVSVWRLVRRRRQTATPPRPGCQATACTCRGRAPAYSPAEERCA